MKALTVVLIIFSLLRLLFGQVPFVGGIWELDVFFAACLLTLAPVHTNAVRGVWRRRKEDLTKQPRFKGKPELSLISSRDFNLLRPRLAGASRVLFAARHSEVELFHCVLPSLGAFVCFLAGVYVTIRHPYWTFTTPHIQPSESGSLNIPPKTVSLGIWWIPFALCIRFVYVAAAHQQKWRYQPIWTLTPSHFTANYQESALMPELKLTDNPFPTDQIVRVWPAVDYWGKFKISNGYGTLYFERSIDPNTKDEDNVIPITNLPRVRELADMLISVCPRARGDQQIGAFYAAAPAAPVQPAPQAPRSLSQLADDVRRAAHQAEGPS
jgi:hypothetical protein